jgi:branched-chain amino acid transport system ATP-binding protein
MPLLEIKSLSKHFGGLTALNDVSFAVNENSIHGLIGPNGAGKSTMFKNIAGFYKPSSGDIRFDGASIVGLSPARISTVGIVRTFQETTLFDELSVLDNVLIGTHKFAQTNVISAVFGLDRNVQKQARDNALAVLEFMGLTERQEQLAGELPLGSQRALAMAIALASKPRLMLMDEPFAGMNPEETGQMMKLTRKIRDTGVTIVLVEHDMKAVMGLCDRLTVLNFGTLLTEGTPDEISQHPEVIAAYLGGGVAA